MLNDFIDILREVFDEQIQAKTAFGRNEIKLVLERSMSNAALRYLSQAGNTTSLKEEKEENPHDIQNNS